MVASIKDTERIESRDLYNEVDLFLVFYVEN